MECCSLGSGAKRACTGRRKALIFQILLGLTLLAAGCLTGPLAHADENKAKVPCERHGPTIDTWQKRRLFQPTPAELERERRGQVMIYEGITDTDVQSAMDERFGRVEAMMFVGTILTDEQGDPQLDVETKEPLVEDDGC
jgi:hypothetical protein